MEKFSGDFLKAMQKTAKVNFTDAKKVFEEKIKNRKTIPEGRFIAKLQELEPGVINEKPIMRPKWLLVEDEVKGLRVSGNTFWLHNEGGIGWFIGFLNMIGFEVESMDGIDKEVLADICKEIKSKEIFCLIRIKHKDDSDFPDVSPLEKYEGETETDIKEEDPEQEQEPKESLSAFDSMSVKSFTAFCKKQQIKDKDVTKMVGKNYGDEENTKQILSQYTFKEKKLTDEEKEFLTALGLDSFIE